MKIIVAIGFIKYAAALIFSIMACKSKTKHWKIKAASIILVLSYTMMGYANISSNGSEVIMAIAMCGELISIIALFVYSIGYR